MNNTENYSLKYWFLWALVLTYIWWFLIFSVKPVIKIKRFLIALFFTASLKKMLGAIEAAETDDSRVKAFEPLQELLTLVQFANDECDYGMGLELGLNLFAYGSLYLHKTILNLLPLAYEFLDRNLFSEIIKAHLKDRRSGSNLSVL